MNRRSDQISALATAIYGQLSGGSDVVLTGFGCLRRVHEPARVSTRDDGQKVLLPPQNVIRITADTSLLAASDDALVRALSDALPEHTRDPREILDDIVSRLRESFASDKELFLEKVGHFSEEDGLTVFKADDSLVAEVNKLFAGLPPIAPRPEAGSDYSRTEAVSPSPVEESIPPLIPPTTVLDVLASQSIARQSNDDSEELGAQEPTSEELESESEAVPPPLPTADDAETTPTEEVFADAVLLGETAESDTRDSVDKAANEMDVPESEADVTTPEDDGIEDAGTDDDIDALLANIWTPAAEASGDDTLEPASSTSDLDEDALVFEELETEEEEYAVSPLVAAGAGVATSARAPFTFDPDGLPERERKRNRMALVLVPAVLVLCTLTVIALWPRFNNGSMVGSQLAENGGAESLREASTDTALYATHAGGIVDSDLAGDSDLSTFESAQMQQEDDASSPEPRPESVVEIPQPAPRVSAPTSPPAAARSEPTPPQIPDLLPEQLRGPGEVNPSDGGATWIVASGNRTSAEDLAARYRRQGFRSSVLAAEANGLAVYRVAVGQFANAAEARQHRSRLPADAPAGTWVLNF